MGARGTPIAAAAVLASCTALFPVAPGTEPQGTTGECVPECGPTSVCRAGACVLGTADDDGDGYTASADCDDQDANVIPGSTRACSSACGQGREVCREGRWDDCSAPADCSCDPGQTRVEACGSCGTAERACSGEGLWGPLGDCAGQGVCAAGETESRACGDGCGRETRVCSADCAWGAWSACDAPADPCTPGETRTSSCGRCGLSTETCGADCTWSAPSACENEGECRPDDNEDRACGACEVETRTCGPDCRWSGWSACGAPSCAPGEVETATCGTCGTTSRTCGADCAWGPWGTCDEAGECAPGAAELEACGSCGTRRRFCDGTCQWEAWGACQGEGFCAPGDTTPCAAGCGTRICSILCEWGPCDACYCVAGDGMPDSCEGEGSCAEGDAFCDPFAFRETVCAGDGVTCSWSSECTDFCQL